MSPTVEEWQIKAKKVLDKISDENDAYHINILTVALVNAYYEGANEGLVRGCLGALSAIKKGE